MGKLMINGQAASGAVDDASSITYDTTTSGLGNGTVQSAIDTLETKKVNAGGGETRLCKTTFTSADKTDDQATSWTTVNTLTSGENHQNIFYKVSQMFKNIRYLYKMLGTTDISAIGDGTVTGAISTQNDNFANPTLLSSGTIDDTLTYNYTGYRFLLVVINNGGWRDTKLVSLSGNDIGGAFTMIAQTTNTYQYITRTSCYPHGNNTVTGGNKYVYGIK